MHSFTKRQEKKWLNVVRLFLVLILLSVLVTAKEFDLLPSFSTPSWTTVIATTLVAVGLVVALIVVTIHQKNQSTQRTATTGTEASNEGNRSKPAWPLSRIVVLSAISVAAVLAIYFIFFAKATKRKDIVVAQSAKNIEISQPEVGAETTARREEIKAPSLVDFAPRARMNEKLMSRHLFIGPDEVQVPLTKKGTNDWDIRIVDSSKELLVRGVKDGKSTSWGFYSGKWPEVDVYFISCPNCRNGTKAEVVWTEDKM